MIKLFNSLTRTKEEFVSIIPRIVKLYGCGPTVYNYAHIGNLRTFLFEDVLKKWLKYRNYEVLHIKNITDVDDKIIQAAEARGEHFIDLSREFTKAFVEDCRSLNIEMPSHLPRATNYIDEMIKYIQHLLDTKYAYQTSSGVYFRWQGSGLKWVFPGDYENLESNASGRNTTSEDKEHPSDWALWKAWTVKDGLAAWKAPFGKGRPGWHLECTIMADQCTSLASKIKGYPTQSQREDSTSEQLDIHAGGIDLMFPHHHAEQCQYSPDGATRLANYWLHAEHLLVDGLKMSKSLGNFYTLRDLVAKGYEPTTVRYLLTTTHYRSQQNFTLYGLDAAKATVEKLNGFHSRLKTCAGMGWSDFEEAHRAALRNFEAAMDDDLNVNEAIAELFIFENKLNQNFHLLSHDNASLAIELLNKYNNIFHFLKDEKQLSPEEENLLQERAKARSLKNFKESDRLRDILKDLGVVVKDTPNGQQWSKL